MSEIEIKYLTSRPDILNLDLCIPEQRQQLDLDMTSDNFCSFDMM